MVGTPLDAFASSGFAHPTHRCHYLMALVGATLVA
jgi:hypothetical protein